MEANYFTILWWFLPYIQFILEKKPRILLLECGYGRTGSNERQQALLLGETPSLEFIAKSKRKRFTLLGVKSYPSKRRTFSCRDFIIFHTFSICYQINSLFFFSLGMINMNYLQSLDPSFQSSRKERKRSRSDVSHSM